MVGRYGSEIVPEQEALIELSHSASHSAVTNVRVLRFRDLPWVQRICHPRGIAVLLVVVLLSVFVGFAWFGGNLQTLRSSEKMLVELKNEVKCGLVEDNIEYWTESPLYDLNHVISAEMCRIRCERDSRCGVWTWEKIRIVNQGHVCSLKALGNQQPKKQRKEGVMSGLLCQMATTIATTSASTAVTWVRHVGLNCFRGHGGINTMGSDRFTASMPLADCKTGCKNDKECEGVIVWTGKDPTACWRMMSVTPAACVPNTGFDLWNKEAVNNVQDKAITTTPSTALSSTFSTVSTMSIVAESVFQGPHVGQNCFGGHGGILTTSPHHFIESLPLEKCKASCKEDKECEAVIVWTDRDPTACWHIKALVQSECLQSPGFDLWVLSPPRSVSLAGTSITLASTSTTLIMTSTYITSITHIPTTVSTSTTSVTYTPTTVSTSTTGNTRNVVFITSTSTVTITHTTFSTSATPASTTTSKHTALSTSVTPAMHTTYTCPACSPIKRPVPAIVIPFFERDLCKLKYTARSISMHDREHYLGDVYLIWVSTDPTSKYEIDLAEIQNLINHTHKVHLFDFSWQVNHAKKGGWYAQQIFKLKVASIVTADYYLVLDCKNTIIRDIRADTFFNSCNQARIFGEFEWSRLPGLHLTWYNTSAHFLNVSLPSSGYWPASITPMIFHKQTVFDMLSAIGENSSPYNLCDGPLCGMLDDGATEFTLYLMFARSQNEPKCVHFMQRMHWSHEVAMSLWRGLSLNSEQCRNVAIGKQVPLMFGAQHAAMSNMTKAEKRKCGEYMFEIIENAKLNDTNITTIEDLLECIA